MQCPTCAVGTILTTPLRTGSERFVVCSNVNCFEWFRATPKAEGGNGTLTPDPRTTGGMRDTIPMEKRHLLSGEGGYPAFE